jgi:thiol-disulfide isomerase/thioredoxin
MSYRDKYLKYKAKYESLKSLQMTGGADADKTVYLFKASWCPHCTNFAPVWNKLSKSGMNDVNFVTYDADTHKEEIRNYEVSSFPTIILKKNNKAIEYSGSRDINSIKEFIKSN